MDNIPASYEEICARTGGMANLSRAITALRAAHAPGERAVSIQHVGTWKRRPVGTKYALDVEAATGIPRWRIRPDIYPPPGHPRHEPPPHCFTPAPSSISPLPDADGSARAEPAGSPPADLARA